MEITDLANNGNKTCEYCSYFYENLNGKKLDLSSGRNPYCSMHTDWKNSAGLTKSDEIKECLKKSYKDYWNLDKKLINDIKSYFKYYFDNPNPNGIDNFMNFLNLKMRLSKKNDKK